MRAILGTCCAVALLLCTTTCGTVRAIQGDFASDAPQLLGVSPTQVVSGQFVDFVAQVVDVTGDAFPADDQEQEQEGRVGDVQYFWDFGGAAEPNTSTLPTPAVQIRSGANSPYTASLTLTDGTPGGDDKQETYEFQIFVTPLQVATAGPTTGIAGGTAVYSALIDSGNVQRYQWDFGGAANPGGSTDPSPAVTFTNTPGTYNASVIVSNNFEADEFEFTIEVLPDPEAAP